MGDLEPFNTQPPNSISIGLAVFIRLMNVANGQTNRPRYSVCIAIGRNAMLCNK